MFKSFLKRPEYRELFGIKCPIFRGPRDEYGAILRHLWRTHFGSDRPRGEAKGSRKKRYPPESLKSNFIRGPPKLPQTHYRPMPAGDAQPRGGNKKNIGPKSPKEVCTGIGRTQVQEYCPPVPAGKAKPRGPEKRVSEPKGENQNGLGVGERSLSNHDRPMLAGKASPRGPEKKS